MIDKVKDKNSDVQTGDGQTGVGAPPTDLEHLSLVVKDRKGEVYSGSVLTVSSLNDIGAFDVMPLHANMVTTIQEKIIIGETSGNNKEIPLNTGLLRVTNNRVEVFVGL